MKIEAIISVLHERQGRKILFVINDTFFRLETAYWDVLLWKTNSLSFRFLAVQKCEGKRNSSEQDVIRKLQSY